MPNWYWEKKDLRNTPSQAKGMDYDTETRYRREGVRFILEIGRTMSLYHLTLATGAVYFHRFYMFHAFQDFPRYVVATCCLFLAGKAEETPKKCRDIVRTVRTLTNDKQFATFGLDPKEEIMVLERVLLQTIKFDLQVDHPYQSIIKFAKSLKGDSAKLHKMVQMSWTFVNDSLCTTLCLQWEPEIIAIAVMYLAAKLSKFEVKDWENRKELGHEHWWDMYVDNLETADLEEICHQVLDLYIQQPTPAKDAADSPPQPGTPGSTPNSNISSQGSRQSSALGQNSENKLSSSQQQSYRKTTPPNPPQPKSRPQTPPPLPPSVPSGGSNQGSSQNSKPPPPLTAATTNPPVGLPAPPTTALPPPLPSSSSVSGNNSMHSGVPSVYQQQYSGQPPLPPTGMYPNSGLVTVAINLGWNDLAALPPGGSRGPGSGSYSQMHGASTSGGLPVGGYPPAGYGMPPHASAPPTGPPPGVYPGVPRDSGSAAPYNYHNSGYYAQGPPNHPPPSSYHQGPRY